MTMRALVYLFPTIHNSCMTGRAIVTADGIQKWDAALGQQPTTAEIEAAELPGAKSDIITKIRAEAAALILGKWPAWAQSNCALGIYPEATAAQCAADIAAVVTVSNTAEDAVTAATTVAEVEAVTATWPTL